MPKSAIDAAIDAHRPRGIQSVERATAILEIIAQEGGSARLQTIANYAGLKKSTAHNILATLEKLGYVGRGSADAQYYLGDRIMNLARIIGDDGSLRARLRPTVETIAARSGQSVYLAVPSGDQIFYIDGIDADDPNQRCSRIGARKPLEGSAIGLVFLALVPELRQRVLSVRPTALNPEVEASIAVVRERGFAVDLQNANPDLNCVAVPVFEGGRVSACIAARGAADKFTSAMLNEVAWMMVKVIGSHPPLRHRKAFWPLSASF